MESSCLTVYFLVCSPRSLLLQPEWKIADPVCTFVFSVLVLITTITIMRDILVVLMEGQSKVILMAILRILL